MPPAGRLSLGTIDRPKKEKWASQRERERERERETDAVSGIRESESAKTTCFLCDDFSEKKLSISPSAAAEGPLLRGTTLEQSPLSCQTFLPISPQCPWETAPSVFPEGICGSTWNFHLENPTIDLPRPDLNISISALSSVRRPDG